VDFSGGLGDFFLRAWITDVMKILDEAEDMVNVVQICNNHSANDILYWHPKRRLFRIFDALSLKAYWADRGADHITANRMCYEHFGIPYRMKAWRYFNNPQPLDERGPLEFYKPTWYPHHRVIPGPNAVVFAGPASTIAKSIPHEMHGPIIQGLIEKGIEVHALYRNEPIPRGVLQLGEHPLLHVHTCLTVPATAQLVRDCSASICSHSAVLQLGWLEWKKTVAIYPAGYPDWMVESNQYTWGRKRETSLNLAFDPARPDDPSIVEQTIAHIAG
jgi:hypothetical protein